LAEAESQVTITGATVAVTGEALQVTITTSQLVDHVDAEFVTQGRFRVTIPAAMTPGLEEVLPVAQGAVVELLFKALSDDPPQTEVILVLNTPVACRAQVQEPNQVLITAQSPPPPVPRPISRRPSAARTRLDLDFVKADLLDVAKALALQSGRNIVVSKEGQAEVTVQLLGVTLEQALDFITKANGLAYREVEGTFIIGPAEQLDKAFVEPTVVEIAHVPSTEQEKVKTVLPKVLPDLTVETYGPDGLLLVGTQADVQRARDWLPKLVEEAPAAPPVMEILPVQHVPPAQAQGLLSKALPDLTLEVQEGLLALLAIGPPARIQQARTLLAQLDVPPPPPQVELVPVPKGEPARWQALLTKAVPGLEVDPQEGQLALLGTAEQLQRARALLDELLPPVRPPRMEVLHLEHASAARVQGLLSKALPDATVEAQEGLNALVFVGSEEDLRRAHEWLDQLDVPAAAPTPPPPAAAEPPRTEAYVCKHLPPAALQRLLAQTFPDLQLAAEEEFKVLTLTGPAERVTAARSLLEQIDGAPPMEGAKGPGGAPPPEVAPVSQPYNLQRLTPEEVQSMVAGAVPKVTVEKQPTGGLLLKGPEADVAQALALLNQVDLPLEMEVYKVRYASAATLGEILPKQIPGLQVSFLEKTVPGGAGGGGTGGRTGMAAPPTAPAPAGGSGPRGPSSLVLIGTRPELDRALQLLEKLDTPAPQVAIEAIISDISPESLDRIGVNWGASSPMATINVVETAGEGLRFGSFQRQGMTLTAALELLNSDSHSKLLAQPNIVTVDDVEARILSGQRIPYEVREVVGGQIITSVQIEQVGINLTLTPHVTGDGHITVRVKPEVSSFQGFSPAGYPIVSTREAEAIVRVEDGGVIVIGGLLREEDIRTMSKIPLLGDIPILGELFQFRSRTKRLTELVILISCRALPEETGAEREG